MWRRQGKTERWNIATFIRDPSCETGVSPVEIAAGQRTTDKTSREVACRAAAARGEARRGESRGCNNIDSSNEQIN